MAIPNEKLKLIRSSDGAAYGTAGAGVTVVEKGAGVHRVTEITIPAGFTLATVTNANKAEGKTLYTFPAGMVAINNAITELTLKGSAGIATINPTLALGTVEATGTVNVLTGTATFIDILAQAATGQVATAGVAVTRIATSAKLLQAATTGRAVALNVAAAWGGTGTLTAEGKVIIHWTAL